MKTLGWAVMINGPLGHTVLGWLLPRAPPPRGELLMITLIRAANICWALAMFQALCYRQKIDFPFYPRSPGPRESTIQEKLSVFQNRPHINTVQVWNVVRFYSLSQYIGFHIMSIIFQNTWAPFIALLLDFGHNLMVWWPRNTSTWRGKTRYVNRNL